VSLRLTQPFAVTRAEATLRNRLVGRPVTTGDRVEASLLGGGLTLELSVVDVDPSSPAVVEDETDITVLGDDEADEAGPHLVARLETVVDDLRSSGRTVVVVATTDPGGVPEALRRGERLDREIELDSPDRADRRDVLASLLDDVTRADSVDLDAVAARTHGFVAADLASLVDRVIEQAVARAGSTELLVSRTSNGRSRSSIRAASGTCSGPPGRTPRRSSSSTKSTPSPPSVVTVIPAPASGSSPSC
jgi:hypothetical protein